MSADPHIDRLERLITLVTELKVTLGEQRQDMQTHIQDDADRFQVMTGRLSRIRKSLRRIGRKASQTATTYRTHWGIAAAWVGGAITVASLAWALWLQFGGGK